MFPIRDVNPTRIQPILTWALIAANVAVYLLLQPQQSPEATEFVYEYAAIPCEVTTGDPLDVEEIVRRQDAVESLLRDSGARERARESLASIQDIERLLARSVGGMANPRELLGLRVSLLAAALACAVAWAAERARAARHAGDDRDDSSTG